MVLLSSIALGVALVFRYIETHSGFTTFIRVPPVMISIFLVLTVLSLYHRYIFMRAMRAGLGGVARLDKMDLVGKEASDDPLYDFTHTIALDNGKTFQVKHRGTRSRVGSRNALGEFEPIVQLHPNNDLFPSVRSHNLEPTKRQIDRLPEPGEAPRWSQINRYDWRNTQWIRHSTLDPDWEYTLSTQRKPGRTIIAAILGLLIGAILSVAIVTDQFAAALWQDRPQIASRVFPNHDPANPDNSSGSGTATDIPELDPLNPDDLSTIFFELGDLADTFDVTSITIMVSPRYVSLDVPIDEEATKLDEYSYHENLGFSHDGAAPVQTHHGVFEAWDVDPYVVEEIASSRPDGEPEDAQLTHILIKYPPPGTQGAGQVAMTAYYSHDYGSFAVQYDLEGEVIRIF